MSAYNYDLSIWFTEVSNSGFRVNGRIKLGAKSWNANGFRVSTAVTGYGSRNHTARIGNKGGTFDFSDYYSVDQMKDGRNIACSVSADMSWSSTGTNTGNPVYANVWVPARPYVGHGAPSLRASKTSGIRFGEAVNLSFGRASNQGNARFDHFELWQGSNKVYSGGGASVNVTPSSVTGVRGGNVTYTLKEVHEWYGTYPSTSTSVTLGVVEERVTVSGCSASRRSDSQSVINWSVSSNASNAGQNILVERRVDEGGWVQIATLGKATTNYTDNGIGSNHRYQYRVRAYNGLYSGYSESGYIYTTPAAPRAVNLSKIGGTKVRIAVDSASPYADGYLYQLSVNGQSWTAEKGMGSSIDVDAGGGTVKARVRAKRGDLRSAYRESGSVTTIVAPSAPTLGEFGSVYAIPTTVRVKWTRLHPDGTEQTAAQVEVTAPNGDVKTTDVTTDNFLDVKLDAEGEYRVRVRTKGLDPSWGAWSPQGSLHAEYAPQAFFTTPSVDGLVVQGVPFIVEWEIETSSGVSSQEIRLLSDSGDVLHAAQLPADARSYSFSVDTYLPQTMRKYTVVLVASDGYSLTAEARRRVETDYAEPAIPYIKVVYDNSDLSAHITVMQGEGGWVVNEQGMLVSPEYWDGSTDHIPVNAGFKESSHLGCIGIGTVVPTVRLSVARLLDDGSQEMLTDDLPSGNDVIDRLPPLNVDYTYLITAYSAAGTATTAEVMAHVDSDGSEAFNFGVDASRSILLGLDADASSGTSHSGEWFEFINGVGTSSLPAFYPDGGMSASGSHSYIVTTADKYRELDAMRRDRSNAVCWFRDHWGGRHRVKADWTLGYSAKSYGTWNVSASLTEAMWEGPRNG